MKFDIITIFPEIFDSYLKESLIKTAQEKGLLSIRVHDIRKYTNDPHKKVDDKPFGGGLGMVMKVEPVYRAVKKLKKGKKSKEIKVSQTFRLDADVLEWLEEQGEKRKLQAI